MLKLQFDWYIKHERELKKISVHVVIAAALLVMRALLFSITYLEKLN